MYQENGGAESEKSLRELLSASGSYVRQKSHRKRRTEKGKRRLAMAEALCTFLRDILILEQKDISDADNLQKNETAFMQSQRQEEMERLLKACAEQSKRFEENEKLRETAKTPQDQMKILLTAQQIGKYLNENKKLAGKKVYDGLLKKYRDTLQQNLTYVKGILEEDSEGGENQDLMALEDYALALQGENVEKSLLLILQVYRYKAMYARSNTGSSKQKVPEYLQQYIDLADHYLLGYKKAGNLEFIKALQNKKENVYDDFARNTKKVFEKIPGTMPTRDREKVARYILSLSGAFQMADAINLIEKKRARATKEEQELFENTLTSYREKYKKENLETDNNMDKIERIRMEVQNQTKMEYKNQESLVSFQLGNELKKTKDNYEPVTKEEQEMKYHLRECVLFRQLLEQNDTMDLEKESLENRMHRLLDRKQIGTYLTQHRELKGKKEYEELIEKYDQTAEEDHSTLENIAKELSLETYMKELPSYEKYRQDLTDADMKEGLVLILQAYRYKAMFLKSRPNSSDKLSGKIQLYVDLADIYLHSYKKYEPKEFVKIFQNQKENVYVDFMNDIKKVLDTIPRTLPEKEREEISQYILSISRSFQALDAMDLIENDPGVATKTQQKRFHELLEAHREKNEPETNQDIQILENIRGKVQKQYQEDLISAKWKYVSDRLYDNKGDMPETEYDIKKRAAGIPEILAILEIKTNSVQVRFFNDERVILPRHKLG